MKRTAARLADGREIIYFDTDEDARRDMRDTRVLPERARGGELRRDPLSGEWIIVATHRQDRTHLPSDDRCPLCPSSGERATEIPCPDYEVVVFENRFPSLAGIATASLDGNGRLEPTSLESNPSSSNGDLLAASPSVGRCEIVCFTPDHDASFADLPPERVRTVLEAWTDRTRELSALPGVEQVFAFENRGPEIGVTLTHPHGQIYAYPYVTPRTARILETARAYREESGRNLFADVLAAEESAGTRIVSRSDHWTAFVPAAARWPMEIHVYPRRRVPDLPALNEVERDDFCVFYLDLLKRMDALYDSKLPYVSAWHQAPVNHGRDLAYLRLELLSVRRSPTKIKYLAGSEAVMGAFINDVAPEHAAEALRVPVSAPLTVGASRDQVPGGFAVRGADGGPRGSGDGGAARASGDRASSAAAAARE
jgi:UDPglucose--hexose-1-phosphate uridylyltransferase